jgi:hypothetical protein
MGDIDEQRSSVSGAVISDFDQGLMKWGFGDEVK